jgi:FixJ family two-component response regulator
MIECSKNLKIILFSKEMLSVNMGVSLALARVGMHSVLHSELSSLLEEVKPDGSKREVVFVLLDFEEIGDYGVREAVSRLKRVNQSLICLLVAGDECHEQVIRLKRDGIIADFLFKPFEFGELKDRLLALMPGKSRLQMKSDSGFY